MTLRPDPAAKRLADEMATMDGVMHAILDETIPAAGETNAQVTESGRTLCESGAVHGPLARFPSSVELASCPTGSKGGTWHSHVTQDQLRNPTNSLPDTANVIFGEMGVSAVVGTQSMETVVAPSDAAAGQQTFRDALGVDVNSTEDVVDAIMEGHVASPADARERVRSRMSGLFSRKRLNFHDLDSRLNRSSIPAHSPMSFEQSEAMLYSSLLGRQADRSGVRRTSVARRRARRGQNAVKKFTNESRVGRIVTNSAIAQVANVAIRRSLGL